MDREQFEFCEIEDQLLMKFSKEPAKHVDEADNVDMGDLYFV